MVLLGRAMFLISRLMEAAIERFTDKGTEALEVYLACGAGYWLVCPIGWPAVQL